MRKKICVLFYCKDIATRFQVYFGLGVMKIL